MEPGIPGIQALIAVYKLGMQIRDLPLEIGNGHELRVETRHLGASLFQFNLLGFELTRDRLMLDGLLASARGKFGKPRGPVLEFRLGRRVPTRHINDLVLEHTHPIVVRGDGRIECRHQFQVEIGNLGLGFHQLRLRGIGAARGGTLFRSLLAHAGFQIGETGHLLVQIGLGTGMAAGQVHNLILQ